MRDASTPKLKLAAKILHAHSFVVFFFNFFFLHGDSEFWLDVFHPTNLRS